MVSTSIYELVPKQIELLSQRKFEWLSFPHELEERYEMDVSAFRLGRLWVEGLVAIVFFNIFLFANHLLLSSVSWQDVLFRSGLVTPVALLVNLVMRMRPSKFYREASIALAACWICYTHLYLELGQYAMGAAYAQVGVIVTILFTNVVMRVQFPYALAVSVAMVAGDLLFLRLDHFEGPAEKVFAATLTLMAIVMTMMANYSLEREQRLGYLLRLRGEIQSDELTLINRELHRISNLDGLTGLGNRHAFAAEYMKQWKHALTSRSPLSAVLIDIDNFKLLNDMCGHLYGDQVLSRVALLVQQALRGKGDFAARFGGEEFACLLPDASHDEALLIAERIRGVIAGTPVVIGTIRASVTVSVGVSHWHPTCSIEKLIHEADKALYQAKRNGRDQVMVAGNNIATSLSGR